MLLPKKPFGLFSELAAVFPYLEFKERRLWAACQACAKSYSHGPRGCSRPTMPHGGQMGDCGPPPFFSGYPSFSFQCSWLIFHLSVYPHTHTLVRAMVLCSGIYCVVTESEFKYRKINRVQERRRKAHTVQGQGREGHDSQWVLDEHSGGWH